MGYKLFCDKCGVENTEDKEEWSYFMDVSLEIEEVNWREDVWINHKQKYFCANCFKPIMEGEKKIRLKQKELLQKHIDNNNWFYQEKE